MGLDEINNTVSMNFQQVLKPFNYDIGGPQGQSKGLSEEELLKQEQASEPYLLTGDEQLKKGYFSVAMISSCQRLVFDIALKKGVARLHEIGLDYRKEGKIIDFSMGFRHCLVITETEDTDDGVTES
jgi:hypothetical protein